MVLLDKHPVDYDALVRSYVDLGRHPVTKRHDNHLARERCTIKQRKIPSQA